MERQHFRTVLALSVTVALTRFLALSRSIWDWDEGLFCSALRDYDVVYHHPHPPGFPLFVAAAKLVHFLVRDEFHALRAVSLIASLFVFPALYALARALRFPFRTSVIAALLFSFLPNVWFWGGTGFSDVFALVLFLAAAALLFRDDGGRLDYILGGVFFAGALLVRPQNVLLSYPWLVASWRRLRARRFADVLASAALIVLLVLGGYYAAARASEGWHSFIVATEDHQRYVATVDGALNPNRPAPKEIWRDFAVDPVLAGRIATVLALFALAAFIRPRRRHLDVLLTFAPNFFLAWFMLSPTGVSRLSLGYIPMHALLAADGIAVVAALLARRRERWVPALEAAFAAVIILRYAYWIWPALAEVRRHDSPPMAAIRWVQQHVPRDRGKVYVQGGMGPFADAYLGGWKLEPANDDFDPGTAPEEPGAVYIADREYASPRAVNFRRPHRHLWGLFHRRYFEACVVPVMGGPRWMTGTVQYAEGWHDPEADPEGHPFRWMGGQGRIVLQPLPFRGVLTMNFYAPIDVEPPPNVTISFNNTVVERFRADQANFRRHYEFDTGSAPGQLVITVDHAVNPKRDGLGGDTRDLGLRVSAVTWSAAMR